MQALRITALPVGPLQMNAYLVAGPPGGEAVLVDPGDEPEVLLEAVRDSGCRLVGLLATHGHFDHVAAATAIQAEHDLPLLCHPDEAPVIRMMQQAQRAFGFPATPVPRFEPGLMDGLRLPLGASGLLVRHAPGHSPGHVILIAGEERTAEDALVGDLIFADSVGRTDLPGGDQRALERSIRRVVYALPDACRLHPGHGPSTTVGQEKAGNPFVRPL